MTAFSLDSGWYLSLLALPLTLQLEYAFQSYGGLVKTPSSGLHPLHSF